VGEWQRQRDALFEGFNSMCLQSLRVSPLFFTFFYSPPQFSPFKRSGLWKEKECPTPFYFSSSFSPFCSLIFLHDRPSKRAIILGTDKDTKRDFHSPCGNFVWEDRGMRDWTRHLSWHRPRWIRQHLNNRQTQLGTCGWSIGRKDHCTTLLLLRVLLATAP